MAHNPRRATNFFGAASPYLTHPLLTPERSVAEVEAICAEISSTGRVLDVGCGFGRHSIAFSQRGSEVVGIDPSATMVAAAMDRSVAAGVSATFRQMSAAEFAAGHISEPAAAPFDLAICLFTTLGQLDALESPGDHEACLAAMHSAIRPDGHVVIEVPERDRAVDALVEQEQLGPTTVTRTFDPDRSVIAERFTSPDGAFDLAYRVFSADELSDAVTAAGFRIEEIRHNALVPPPPTFMTLFAHRPAR